MPIQQLTTEETFETLKEDGEAVYIDVRSVQEFETEHPEGAFNIPIFHQGPAGMMPNGEFLEVIKKTFPKNKKLLIGCLRGGRSLQACMVLEQEGYEDLSNVLGGFGGNQDPTTGEIHTGWKDADLPTSDKPKEGRDYESLK